jgi:hypothetical protein
MHRLMLSFLFLLIFHFTAYCESFTGKVVGIMP